jgi:hypothetical protein
MRYLSWLCCGLVAGTSCVTVLAQDADPDLSAVSSQNCSFLSDRDSFLKHDLRIRASIHSNLIALQKARAAVAEPQAAVAAAPLPKRNFIDDEVFQRLDLAGVAPAPLSSDEEFVRRLNLDLTGRIPSSGEVRDFVADRSPAKRSALIQKLLVSDAFTDKWTMWMGDLLENNAASVNQANRGINARNAFYRYIWAGVIQQRSIKELAYGVLTATGNVFDDMNAGNFTLNGNAPGGPINDTYDMLLYKATKTFLGLGHYDCLLCHNGRGHLDALSLWGKNTTRTDAEQMAAFFSRTQMTNYAPQVGAPPDQLAFYAGSRVVGDNTTGSYPLPTTFGNRPNRPMVNSQRSVAPRYRTGQTPSTPNWRAEFAALVVQDTLFPINFVNRVWKELFSLGLVDSVDALDPDRLDPSNPPGDGWDLQATHPVLLRRLANEFAAGNFNLRELIRTIAESSTYQLSSRYDGEWRQEYVPLFARHYPRRLMGEEVHDAVNKATGVMPRFTVQGMADPISWAMQLPDTSEPRNNGQSLNFMNLFLRGNRDTITRSQGSTILQSSGLMNDPFIQARIHVNQSPTLQTVAKLPTPDAQLEEMYLTFLSRKPSDYERTRGLAYLAAATTAAARNTALEDLAWALINKLEFQFSY